jgi:hypothetical protein
MANPYKIVYLNFTALYTFHYITIKIASISGTIAILLLVRSYPSLLQVTNSYSAFGYTKHNTNRSVVAKYTTQVKGRKI